MSTIVFKDPGLKIKTPVPSNYGMGKLVNDQVENLVHSQNERQEQVLDAHGFNVHVWIPQKTGKACSCQGPVDTPKYETVEQNEPIDDKFGEVVEDMDLTDEDLEYNVLDAGESLDKCIANSEPLSNTADNSSKSIPNDDLLDSFLTTDEPGIDSISDEESTLNEMDRGDGFQFGINENPCGICFGNGYLDSMQLYGAKRYVFNVVGEFKEVLKGFTIDTEQFPHRYQTAPALNNYVQWSYEAPTYFKEVITIRVFNNTTNISSKFNLQAQINNSGTWVALTKDVLNMKQGERAQVDIRVFPATGDFADEPDNLLQFTHLEVIYQLNDFPKGDMPLLSLPEDYGYADAIIESQMVISSRVPRIPRGTIVGENRRGLLWKVTNTNINYTNGGRIFSSEVDVRLVRSYEQTYALQLNNTKE